MLAAMGSVLFMRIVYAHGLCASSAENARAIVLALLELNTTCSASRILPQDLLESQLDTKLKVMALFGGGVAEIGSPEALADWLEGKPPELVVALASRIALRVLPLAITGNKQEPITLAAFVVCAIAGFSHKKPGLKFSNLAASRVLAHQPTAFSDADYFAFSFAWRVFVDLARLDEANENAKTRAILHSIFGSAGTAAGLAASFDNLYTIGASRFHEERIKREKADGTFPARKSGLIDATAVQMMADSVKQDCDYWERGGIALSNILARPLWPEGAPDFFLREYNRALDLWRTEPENWSNWIEWYERKLRGSRSDWGCPSSRMRNCRSGSFRQIVIFGQGLTELRPFRIPQLAGGNGNWLSKPTLSKAN